MQYLLMEKDILLFCILYFFAAYIKKIKNRNFALKIIVSAISSAHF